MKDFSKQVSALAARKGSAPLALVTGASSGMGLIYAETLARSGCDILAVSQMTPGPVGINTATYTGYTAVLNAGYEPWQAVLGALLASGAVILLPVALMFVAVAFLQRNKGNKDIDNIFSLLRKVVVGLIAAAALQLLTVDSFGMPSLSLQFILSIAVFLAVFILSLRRTSPILLILASGVVGIIVYSFFPL